MTAFMQFEGPNFTLEVPTNWFVSASPQFQAIFMAARPENPERAAGVRPNLAISLRPVQEDVTLGAVAAEALKTQQAEYDGYSLLEEIDYTQQGGVAFYRKYRWVNNEGQTVVQAQTYIIVAQVLFSLTATRGEADEAYNAKLDEIFAHMTDSFRLQL